MIYRIIRASGHPELVEILREAMSRSRKEALQEVRSQSEPLLEHLLPYLAFKKANISPPLDWSSEMKSYLTRIDVKNGKGASGKWLEAKEIENVINEDLKKPILSRAVIRKISTFPEKSKRAVQSFLSKLYSNKDIKLEMVGVSLRHETTDLGEELFVFIEGQRL